MENNYTSLFSKKLLSWFDLHGRKDLPWQQTISAYRVWVSEIMLQQTQVKTVIPYFNRFISTFPSLDNLANAHIDDVLHLWTGLGYYSRARNLHKTAIILQSNYQSQFPQKVEDLMQLPGIGRSTAGAICAIAYQQTTPILDGNVKRVLCRFFGITDDPKLSSTQNTLWYFAHQLMPKKRIRDYTQAIMDLGATICTRSKPKCHDCLFKQMCYAHLHQLTTEIPKKQKKALLPEKSTNVLLIINSKQQVLLEKRPPMGIWGGLWSFPECQTNDIVSYCAKHFAMDIQYIESLPCIRHTFSHFHLTLNPHLMQLNSQQNVSMDYQPLIWYDYQNPQNLGFAAPIKTLINQLQRKLISFSQRELS